MINNERKYVEENINFKGKQLSYLSMPDIYDQEGQVQHKVLVRTPGFNKGHIK